MKKNDESRVTIRLDQLFDGVAKLDELAQYEDRALALAGSGREVVLTGPAPVWLYLRLAIFNLSNKINKSGCEKKVGAPKEVNAKISRNIDRIQ